ncbi:TPA: hypothetical protein H1S40_002600 [Salmonella enterica]|nr:hypothetical protein [Salmonella enterica]HAK4054241.1 hypothetical protein [Salmonella enterica]
MSTLTKEWLLKTIAELEEERDATPGAVNEDAANALAAMKLALASLEAKPIGAFHIADQQVDGTSDYIKDGEWPIDDGVIEVYAAPPAPMAVPAAMEMDDDFDSAFEHGKAVGWNACRAAMLQAEPVSQAYELPEIIEGMEVSIDVSTCDADAGNRYFGTVTEVSELDTAKNGYILLVQDAKPNFDVNGNSPAIPDDWVMVPKEPTQAMINAWLSEVANWRGHVAGYKAALAAAPQHEVK